MGGVSSSPLQCFQGEGEVTEAKGGVPILKEALMIASHRITRRAFCCQATVVTVGATTTAWGMPQNESFGPEPGNRQPGNAVEPILPRVLVSAHRGGGRGVAPDNTPDNVQRAVDLGVTAAELDVIATTDGHLFLFHPYHYWPEEPSELLDIIPDRFKTRGRIDLRGLPLKDIQEIRYSVRVGEEVFEDLRIYRADEVINAFKTKINFHIDPRGPMRCFFDLIQKHGIHDRTLMQFGNYDCAQQMKEFDRRVAIQWKALGVGHYPQNTSPSPEEQETSLRQVIHELLAIGGEMLVMQDLTPEKLRMCHEEGVAVMPRASHVGHTDGANFLKLGVDALMCDAPDQVLKAIGDLLGPEWMPEPGQPISELFAPRRKAN